MAIELAIHPTLAPRKAWPSGIELLDDKLPERGLPADGVTEIMHPQRAAGAGTLSLLIPLMRRLTRGGAQEGLKDGEKRAEAALRKLGSQEAANALYKEAKDEPEPDADMPTAPAWIALVEPGLDLYPPALAAAGVDLDRVLHIRAEKRADQLWALEQCARHPAIALTIGAVRGLQEREARRMQLACQSGPAVLLRPASESGRASSLRLGIRGLPGVKAGDGVFTRRFEIEILRCRGVIPGAPMEVEVRDDGSPMVLSSLSRVSLPAGGQKPSRASLHALGAG